MSKEKKKSLKSGCLKIVVIGFAVILALGFLGSMFAEKEWKKIRPELLANIENAIKLGDYEKAIVLAEPYKGRDDSDLNRLLSEAKLLKLEAQEKLRKEKIAILIDEIEGLEGRDREKALERLLSLDPNTKEFPEETRTIREREEKRKQEVIAKREAQRKEEFEREERVRKEQIRLAMEEKMAEFKWRYQVDEDTLTNKPVYVAWLKSINQVNFSFPYQGEQRGELLLRTHPQHGKDLILRVKKGQMLVRSYEDTSVKVVFDQGSPITYKVVGPSDHGTTSLFFRDYHGFVTRMLKAKKVKVSVPFYQQGNVVFEFNVSDFNAEKYLGKQ